MKVSVVVPVKNEELYIGQCLESLNNQTEKPDEIILVDNHSTDKTLDVIAESQKLAGMPPIVVLHGKEGDGIRHAQHQGFNAAKYEIIARTDADTKQPDFWIKKIKENFQNYTYDALVGTFQTYDSFFKTDIFAKLTHMTHHLFLGHYGLFGFNLAIKKEMWNKVKDKVCLDKPQYHEDLDLSIHVADAGGVIGYDPELYVLTSARRAKSNPKSFFIDYQVRTLQTINDHKHISTKSSLLNQHRES